MQTKTLIQSSCNVIRITSLVKGNIYKRVEDSYGAKIQYGIVLDLFNTGEKTFIQALEYEVSYNVINPTVKVFKGDEDLSIFPATFEEVKEHFAEAIVGLRKRVEDKQKELSETQLGLQRAEEFIGGELQKKLSAASFVEVSQQEFNQKTVAIAEQRESLDEIKF